jgi:hypothetical protein
MNPLVYWRSLTYYTEVNRGTKPKQSVSVYNLLHEIRK